MQFQVEDRYPDASAVADALTAWLEGGLRREEAARKVAQAKEIVPKLEGLRTWAAMRQELAGGLLETVSPGADQLVKAPLWALEDEGNALEHQALTLEVEIEQLLEAALSHDPGFPEAHDMLAALWRDRHAKAEASGEASDRLRAESRLRAHAEAMPPLSSSRGDHLQYLEGHGTVSIVTEPEGAQVWLERYEVRQRRLVAEPVRMIGRTPLRGVGLHMGSYRLKLVASDRHSVCVPVSVPRGGHANGIPPGEMGPEPIHLPPDGVFFDDEVLVPSGWFEAGGDAEAPNGLARQAVWVDAFVMQRFPVTHSAYLSFVESVRLAEGLTVALGYAPRDPGPQGDNRRVFYDQGANGQLLLGSTLEGDTVQPDWPVTFITWHGAMAFSAWYARKTGQAWRLPRELEWEKAARGADGRHYPWGDFYDPSWAAGLLGRDPVIPEPVDSCPIDESPFGVRGMAGNAQDWCLDPFVEGGPELVNGRLPTALPLQEDPDGHHTVRGGGFAVDARWARCASRGRRRANTRAQSLGFRLVRPVAKGSEDA